MIIRQEQMDRFAEEAHSNFEAGLVRRLKETVPTLEATAGEEGVRKSVRLGIERANGHGFTRQGPVQFYVELMPTLGWDFDEDPQYYWIRDILADRDQSQETDRAERLYFHVVNYLDRVAGPNREHEREARQKACAVKREHLATVGAKFDSIALEWLKLIHPRKCEYLGEPALRELARAAVETAAVMSLGWPEGPPLVLLMMFLFGAGVAADPLHPWVAATLEESGDLREKVERLAVRMREQLGSAQKGAGA